MVSAIACPPVNADSQNAATYPLPRLQSSPVLDGVLNDAVWKQAVVINLPYENKPGRGKAAPVHTQAYIFDDGRNLYVAIEAFDPEPEVIRASLRGRDSLTNDDYVGIIVDTFNDRRSAFGFFSNPLGVQADMSRQEQGEIAKDDFGWDAIWDSVGKVNEQGYVVEIRIPYWALRFRSSDQVQAWNIAIERQYPRDTVMTLAYYRRDRNVQCTLCQYERLSGFVGASAGNNLQLTPTLTLARLDNKAVIGDNRGEWQQGNVESEPGLDVRWGITQNWVMNATLNPDFSQVEADAGQLDVNAVDALFFEEKRPFFLDGADYLTVPLLDLVHTRNIVSPAYGIKLTGKSDGHRVGAMLADDEFTTLLLPGNQGSELAQLAMNSTSLISRYRQDIGQQSTAGVFVSHRRGDNYLNQVIAVDGVAWLNESNHLSYLLAHSDTENPDALQQDYGLAAEQSGQAFVLNASHASATQQVSGDNGGTALELDARLERIDRGFRADLGFQERVDYQGFSVSGTHTWFLAEPGWLNEISLYTDWYKSWDLESHLLEDEREFFVMADGTMQSSMELGVIDRNRLYSGRYFRERQYSAWATFNPISDLTLSANVLAGDQVDFIHAQLGYGVDIGATLNWQANRHLQIDIEYEKNQLTVDAGRLFEAERVDTRISWQFTNRAQLRFILRYSQIQRELDNYTYPKDWDKKEREFSSQWLYSYTVNPNTLFYLGYSDSGFEDDKQDQLIRTERTLFAKISYAWQY